MWNRVMTASVCALGLSVSAMAEAAEPPRGLSDFMGCLEVFHEPEANRLRVTTLFCGSNEDGNLPAEFEVRHHAMAVIGQSTQTVEYVLQTMVRSKVPFTVTAVEAAGQRAQFVTDTSKTCAPTETGCWYETAVSWSLASVVGVSVASERLTYRLGSSAGALDLSLNAQELQALTLFTEGLLVSLPDESPAYTGNPI